MIKTQWFEAICHNKEEVSVQKTNATLLFLNVDNFLRLLEKRQNLFFETQGEYNIYMPNQKSVVVLDNIISALCFSFLIPFGQFLT